MNTCNEKYFDEEKVKSILQKHPKLVILFNAGLISRRICRNALEITKWDMDDLYEELIITGAIRVLSSSAFRATNATMALIRRMENEQGGNNR